MDQIAYVSRASAQKIEVLEGKKQNNETKIVDKTKLNKKKKEKTRIKKRGGVPVLLEIVLPLEGLSADLAGEGHVVLMAALVDHEVVGLREAPLAVLADELYRALGAHLLPPAELPAVPLCLHRHYREHPYKFPPLLLLVESLSLLSLYPPLSLSR